MRVGFTRLTAAGLVAPRDIRPVSGETGIVSAGGTWNMSRFAHLSFDVQNTGSVTPARTRFAAFSAAELAARKECFLPPYCHLAVIGFSSTDLRLVGDWATMYARSLQSFAAKSANRPIEQSEQSNKFLVGEATPCALEKAEGRYRWQIVMRAANAAAITKAWRWISSVRPVPRVIRVTLDVDAFNLI